MLVKENGVNKMIDFKMIILFLFLQFFLILLAIQIHHLIQSWKMKRNIRKLFQDDLEESSEDEFEILYDDEQSDNE